MDPLSLIVMAAAAAAGVVGTKIVEDGYSKLKATLVTRFGKESDVAQALKKVEERPDSESRRRTALWNIIGGHCSIILTMTLRVSKRQHIRSLP